MSAIFLSLAQHLVPLTLTMQWAGWVEGAGIKSRSVQSSSGWNTLKKWAEGNDFVQYAISRLSNSTKLRLVTLASQVLRKNLTNLHGTFAHNLEHAFYSALIM